jgi:hypothetical protein
MTGGFSSSTHIWRSAASVLIFEVVTVAALWLLQTWFSS